MPSFTGSVVDGFTKTEYEVSYELSGDQVVFTARVTGSYHQAYYSSSEHAYLFQPCSNEFLTLSVDAQKAEGKITAVGKISAGIHATHSGWVSAATPTATLTLSLPVKGEFYSVQLLFTGNGGKSVEESVFIASATTPVMGSPTLGSAINISLPRMSDLFTHKVSYVFGSQTGVISTNAGSSVTWTPALTLANQIPNEASGVGTLIAETYKGDTLIGTKSIQFTAYVPASVVPMISAVSITEATSGLAAKFQAFVQGKSALAVAITAAGSYSSTISKYETTILGVKYQGASFTSQVIGSSGSVAVSVTVTDSRGRTATTTQTVSVTAYAAPRINSMTAQRINTSGTVDEEGTRVLVTANYAISSVGNKNDHTFTISYKQSGAQYFTDFDSGSAPWSYNSSRAYTSGPNLSVDYAYIIRLTISDYFGSAVLEYEVPTSFVLMDFRSTGKGMAVGKVSEQDKLEVAMPAEITGALSFGAAAKGSLLDLIYPVGSVYLSVVNASPATFFGGTWQLLPAKYLMSAGAVYSGGAEGGHSTHTHSTGSHSLTVEELPSHRHDIAGSYGYGAYAETTAFGGGATPAGGTMHSQYAGSGAAHSHGNTGSADNDPVYVAVFAWKRTA